MALTKFTSKGDVLRFLQADSEEDAERAIYNYTDCGAWIEFHDWGIRVGSIVEGCNFGTATYPLRYAEGFTGKDIDDRLQAVEKEAAALWKWANEGPEKQDEADWKSWAETGLDAPDIDQEYRHLNPDGRSS